MKRSYCKRGDALTIPSSTQKVARHEDEFPTDTEAGLLYLQTLVPSNNGFPQIVLKHQIYSIIKDKTTVDRMIMIMKDNGRVRIIKMDSGPEEYAIIATEQYNKLIKDKLKDHPALCSVVINQLLTDCVDVSVSKVQLMKDLSLTNDDISILVHSGLLVMRDVGRDSNWWFGVPGISRFKREFSKGRRAVKAMFNRSRNRELLEKDLEGRRLPSNCSLLPVEYYIHDLVGSEVLERVETCTGAILRLVE